MEHALARIFVNHRLPGEAARMFAVGMCRYMAECHRQPRCLIMHVPDTDLWPHSPHFRMATAAALRTMFDARITGVSLFPATGLNEPQAITFVDDAARRWIITIEPAGANRNLIYAYAPRPDTPTTTVRRLTLPELMSLTNVQLIVGSTDGWADPA